MLQRISLLLHAIGRLQPIPRNSKDKGVAAMLVHVVLTKGANEKSFVYDHQQGADDITCKPRIVRPVFFKHGSPAMTSPS